MRVSKYGNKEKLKLICIRETLKHNFPFGSCTMCYFIVQNFIKKKTARRKQNENASWNGWVVSCVQCDSHCLIDQYERKIFVSWSLKIAQRTFRNIMIAKRTHTKQTFAQSHSWNSWSHKQFYRSDWLSTLFVQWNIYSNIISIWIHS